jgi:hypothetical protein
VRLPQRMMVLLVKAPPRWACACFLNRGAGSGCVHERKQVRGGQAHAGQSRSGTILTERLLGRAVVLDCWRWRCVADTQRIHEGWAASGSGWTLRMDDLQPVEAEASRGLRRRLVRGVERTLSPRLSVGKQAARSWEQDDQARAGQSKYGNGRAVKLAAVWNAPGCQSLFLREPKIHKR